MPSYKIKNLESSKQDFQRRVFHITVLVLLLTAILFIRLFYLQVIQKDHFSTLSSQNSINLVPLTPQRGLIYDRNGKILAENMPVYSLELVPDQIENLRQVVGQLHEFIDFSPVDQRFFYRQVKEHRPFDAVPLKVQLTDEEVAKFYVNQYKFPGVHIAARLMRYYPYKGDMVDFLGYAGRINQQELNRVDPANYSGTNYIGKLGLERHFEEQLHGITGSQQVEIDAAGRQVRSLSMQPPVSGENLYLTIDADLQEAAVAAITGNRGAVVAIDPRNGQVLAMVSAPSYDPNLFVRGINSQDYQALRNSPDTPLVNRAVRGLYPPGSTMKPIYALQGLKVGAITPEFKIFDVGYYQLKGVQHKYRDWKKHGWVDLVSAIAESCDTYFYRLSDKMGVDNLNAVLVAFGFGALTGIEINEELPGLVPSPAWRMKAKGERWYRGDTLVLGIGQGSLIVTPLQLSAMVAIIAGRGTHYQPTLILKSVDAQGRETVNAPKALAPVEFAPDIWANVIQGMVNVIQSPNGTGYRFGRPGYSVAAKTGTAQLFTVGQHQKYSELKVSERLKDNSLFIAFAPVDHPKIAVAVSIQNNHNASMIARKVLDYYLLQEHHLNDPDPPASSATPEQTHVN